MMANPLNKSLLPNTGPGTERSLAYQSANPSPNKSVPLPLTLKFTFTSQF